MAELKLSVDGLEKERDFYFGKLREVEVFCQELEETTLPDPKQVIDGVMAVLYATEVKPGSEVK